jgi:hypothetical protein
MGGVGEGEERKVKEGGRWVTNWQKQLQFAHQVKAVKSLLLICKSFRI